MMAPKAVIPPLGTELKNALTPANQNYNGHDYVSEYKFHTGILSELGTYAGID